MRSMVAPVGGAEASMVGTAIRTAHAPTTQHARTADRGIAAPSPPAQQRAEDVTGQGQSVSATHVHTCASPQARPPSG